MVYLPEGSPPSTTNRAQHQDSYRNLKFTFSRPGKSWNQAYILESHGNANSWCDRFINDLSE